VTGKDRQRGIILIAVLWSIALLSGLAMAASTTFRSFAGIVTVHRDRLRADALFTAGLEVAAGIIGRLDATPVVELETRLAMPGGGVQIRLGDEGGRIDIGKAPVEVLASLFRHLGARYPDVIAQQIAAWRTTDKDQPRAATSEEAQAPESEWPFSDVRQLSQVPGMSPELFEAAAPLLTIFGNATVNPLTAPVEVIAALPGVGRPQLRAFLETRLRFPTDAARVRATLGPAQQHLAEAPQRVASVELRATLDDGFSAAAKAVIVLLRDDSEPYRILAWNISGPASTCLHAPHLANKPLSAQRNC
jgi:general secretion pathway protein K